MPTRFGVQPLVSHIRASGRTLAGTARYIGEDVTRFRNVAYGKTRPTELMRERLPELFHHELSLLFTPDALEFPHKPVARHGRLPLTEADVADLPPVLDYPENPCGSLTHNPDDPVCRNAQPCPVHADAP